MQVVFVAPFAMQTTLRFVRAAAGLPGVSLGIISQQGVEPFRQALGSSLEAFQQIQGPLDAEHLTRAVRDIAPALGGRVDRLIGVLEQLQEPLGEVRERLQIRGMDRSEAANFRDKARMKSILRAAGLPCAKHRLASTPEAALEFAAQHLPLVAKPPAGAGARNTARVESIDQLKSYLRGLPPSAEQPLLLEEFILGKEHSFDTISLHGKHLFHSISRYTPTPLEVMENPWIQWCVVLPSSIDGDEYDDIRRDGCRALDALGMQTGLTHMEWFRRPDGTLAISEVAARPPGAQFTTLLSYAHDLDFYSAWARLMIYEEFVPPLRRYAVGAIYLRAQGAGQTISQVRGLEQVERELGELIVESKFPKLGSQRAEDYEGDGYLILRHPDTKTLEAGLTRALQLISIESNES